MNDLKVDRLTSKVFASVYFEMNKDSKIRKPTRVYGDAWIYEEDPEISKICPNPEWNCGSWLMFFDNSVVDDKWDQAVQLYRQVIL